MKQCNSSIDYSTISYISKVLNHNNEAFDEPLIWGIAYLPFISKKMFVKCKGEKLDNVQFKHEKMMVLEGLSRLSQEYTNIFIENDKDKLNSFQYFTYKKQYPYLSIKKSLYTKYIGSHLKEIPENIGMTVLKCSPLSNKVKILDTISKEEKNISKKSFRELLKEKGEYYEDLEYLISYPTKKVNNLDKIVRKSIKDNLRVCTDKNLDREYSLYRNYRGKESRKILSSKYDFFYKYIEFLEACQCRKLFSQGTRVDIYYRILKEIRKEINSRGKIDWKIILLSEKEFYKNIREYMG